MSKAALILYLSHLLMLMPGAQTHTIARDDHTGSWNPKFNHTPTPLNATKQGITIPHSLPAAHRLDVDLTQRFDTQDPQAFLDDSQVVSRQEASPTRIQTGHGGVVGATLSNTGKLDAPDSEEAKNFPDSKRSPDAASLITFKTGYDSQAKKVNPTPGNSGALSWVIKKVSKWKISIQKVLAAIFFNKFSSHTSASEQDGDIVQFGRKGEDQQKLNIQPSTFTSVDRGDSTIVHNRKNANISRTTSKARRKRAAHSTSKFTGLVVGATENKKLRSSVAKFLRDLEKAIWKQQSAVTREYSKDKPASILGAFSSNVITNFRGIMEESKLRHDAQYKLPDVNALTQLLVLNSLTEAGIYGSAQNPDVGEVLDMLTSLDAFHLQGRNGGR